MKHLKPEFQFDDVGARGRVTGDEWLALAAAFETLFSEPVPPVVQVLQEDDGEVD